MVRYVDEKSSEAEFLAAELVGIADSGYEGKLVRRTVELPGHVAFDLDCLSQNTGMSRNRLIVRLVQAGLEATKAHLEPVEAAKLFTLKDGNAFERSQAHE